MLTPPVVEIVKNSILLFVVKRGRSEVKQTFSVDLNKPVKIGGFSESGYMLNTYPSGTPSHTCLKTTELLYVLKDGHRSTINGNIYLLKK